MERFENRNPGRLIITKMSHRPSKSKSPSIIDVSTNSRSPPPTVIKSKSSLFTVDSLLASSPANTTSSSSHDGGGDDQHLHDYNDMSPPATPPSPSSPSCHHHQIHSGNCSPPLRKPVPIGNSPGSSPPGFPSAHGGYSFGYPVNLLMSAGLPFHPHHPNSNHPFHPTWPGIKFPPHFGDLQNCKYSILLSIELQRKQSSLESFGMG